MYEEEEKKQLIYIAVEIENELPPFKIIFLFYTTQYSYVKSNKSKGKY